jgi:hypothetical protein
MQLPPDVIEKLLLAILIGGAIRGSKNNQLAFIRQILNLSPAKFSEYQFLKV